MGQNEVGGIVSGEHLAIDDGVRLGVNTLSKFALPEEAVGIDGFRVTKG